MLKSDRGQTVSLASSAVWDVPAISDSRSCHTAVLYGRWRRFYLVSWTTTQGLWKAGSGVSGFFPHKIWSWGQKLHMALILCCVFFIISIYTVSQKCLYFNRE